MEMTDAHFLSLRVVEKVSSRHLNLCQGLVIKAVVPIWSGGREAEGSQLLFQGTVKVITQPLEAPLSWDTHAMETPGCGQSLVPIRRLVPCWHKRVIPVWC